MRGRNRAAAGEGGKAMGEAAASWTVEELDGSRPNGSWPEELAEMVLDADRMREECSIGLARARFVTRRAKWAALDAARESALGSRVSTRPAVESTRRAVAGLEAALAIVRSMLAREEEDERVRVLDVSV
jgi:hypothetical protein